MRNRSAQPGASLRPYFVLAGAQVAVGAAAIFARFALTGAGALTASASRMTIAALILLALAAIRKPHAAHRRQPHSQWLFIAAGFALAVHFATWIWSLQYTTIAISTLLVATVPVWTALYDWIGGKARLSPVAWLSLAAGGLGVALIVQHRGAPPPIPGHAPLGAALAIAGAIGIAAYFILIRAVRQAYGTRDIVTRTYTYAAVILIVAAFFARQPLPKIDDGVAWGGILAMALVSQLMGHTAMNAALRWFSAGAVAFTTLVEPIVAAMLALAIFGERIGAPAVAGGLLVLGAIAVFIREERRGEARYEVKAVT